MQIDFDETDSREREHIRNEMNGENSAHTRTNDEISLSSLNPIPRRRRMERVKVRHFLFFSPFIRAPLFIGKNKRLFNVSM